MQKNYLITAKISDYLTITSLEDNNDIILYDLSTNGYDPSTLQIKYSLDGANWYNFTFSPMQDFPNNYSFKVTLNTNDDIYFKGINTQITGLTFKSTKKCNISGKISSLFTESSHTVYNKIIHEGDLGEEIGLFNYIDVVDASKLILNAENSCFASMFSGCANLTKPPKLIAKTIANNSYYCMFQHCNSLTYLPLLSILTLTEGCYYSMFWGVTILKISTTQTEECPYELRIPASGNGTNATNALKYMFFGASGISTGTPTINTTYYCNLESK